MANENYIFNGDVVSVAQIATGSIDSLDGTPTNNTFHVTIGSVTISQAGDTDVSTTAAALVVKLEASTDPRFAEITWTNPSAGNITATADTAGLPFVAVLTETGAGTGAVTDFADDTADASANSWNVASNWSDVAGGAAAIPGNAATQTAVVEKTSTAIKYGLDQSGAANTLSALHFRASYTGGVGLPHRTATSYREYREPYLSIAASAFTIGEGGGDGSSRIKLDSLTVQTAGVVHKTATATDSGRHAVQWKGTHASNTLTVHAGTVDVAPDGVDAATILTLTINGGTVRTSPTTTLTNVTMDSGTLACDSAVATLKMKNSAICTYGTGNITTLDVDGSTWTSTCEAAITITTLDATNGSTVTLKPHGTITTCNNRSSTVTTDGAVTNLYITGTGATQYHRSGAVTTCHLSGTSTLYVVNTVALSISALYLPTGTTLDLSRSQNTVTVTDLYPGACTINDPHDRLTLSNSYTPRGCARSDITWVQKAELTQAAPY